MFIKEKERNATIIDTNIKRFEADFSFFGKFRSQRTLFVTWHTLDHNKPMESGDPNDPSKEVPEVMATKSEPIEIPEEEGKETTGQPAVMVVSEPPPDGNTAALTVSSSEGTTLELPEGTTLMVGEDGQQYVTVPQDGQMYAIPLHEYQSLRQAPPPPKDPLPPKAPIVVRNKFFKPIRVDNWGIFLLNRLQSFFSKKEYCDLALKFPAKQAQIKVHRLVVHSCTDFFHKLERQGGQASAIEMPSHMQPEYVAPIIKFMYTGKLEIRPGTYEELKSVAQQLEMHVLLKLMEAQEKDSPIIVEPSSRKRKRDYFNDPIKQIKKIRQIEKRFEAQNKRQKLMAAKEARQQVCDTLPGKKLPIWKKRTTLTGQTGPVTAPPSLTEDSPVLNATSKSYSKSDTLEKSPAAKQRENENFEKIRQKTDTDMSMEDIKEFMDEQRKRLNEQDDDDYYDNDAEIGYDDYDEEGDEEDEEEEGPKIPTKPILKSPIDSPTPTPRKSVRFSLRSGSVPQKQMKDSAVAEKMREDKTILNEEVSEHEEESSSPPKQASFNNTKCQTTRVITQSKPTRKPDPALSANQKEIVTELLKRNPDLFKDKDEVKLKVMIKDSKGNSKLQNLVLKSQGAYVPLDKRYPSARAKPKPKTPPATVVNNDKKLFGIRQTPPVVYTGKPGRPKAIKKGQVDPHKEEREEIEKNLQKKLKNPGDKIMIEYATLEDVRQDEVTQEEVPTTKRLDPSSEAEALSNVASGIATSLGLVSSPDHPTGTSLLDESNGNPEMSEYSGNQSFQSPKRVTRSSKTSLKEETASDWDQPS